MQSLNKLLLGKLYKTESPIEKIILDELLNYYPDIKFETQVEVSPYRLDFAISEYKLALEVDGAAYHNSDANIARDQLRDEILKEQGWIIERVPGWFCYRMPDCAVIKMLRHYPNIEKNLRFQSAKNRTIQWYIGDLVNRGHKNRAEKLLERSTEI